MGLWNNQLIKSSMKRKVLIFLMILLFTVSVYGQDKLPVYVVSRDYGMTVEPMDSRLASFYANRQYDDRYTLYCKKAKILNVAGWISLGVGIPVSIVSPICGGGCFL